MLEEVGGGWRTFHDLSIFFLGGVEWEGDGVEGIWCGVGWCRGYLYSIGVESLWLVWRVIWLSAGFLGGGWSQVQADGAGF